MNSIEKLIAKWRSRTAELSAAGSICADELEQALARESAAPAALTPLEVHRNVAKAQIRKMGFIPSEEIIQPWDGKHGSLQWEWRKAGCRRDPSEIIWAVIDGLTQEGIAAWPGDATSIVEQIVRVQYDRAETALAARSSERDAPAEPHVYDSWRKTYNMGDLTQDASESMARFAWDAALRVVPAAQDAVRREALEEAAQVIDEEIRQRGRTDIDHMLQIDELATKIRALAASPANKEK